ncbi:hypothetical protein FDJ25_gp068 [Vibrio phage Aphrodite1]|uniref:Uncharacterized protein n=1 Tax=Vibrio phage Aphrodite1 TaxID=2070057 RepID=A0A2I7QHZ1_9CAUD|nr:hypothetical protein FDJ25_gp068 [Vibrio phage Aphrodite1]AUR81021.1 hypothetical protein Aphrodite1_0135 [Vibrio phage Aphrodite1]
MNTCRAFSMGTSGIVHDNQMQSYANMIQMNFEQVQNVGGWLGEGASNFMDSFKNFVNTRAWDLASRIRGNAEDHYIGYYDIGIATSMEMLQASQGFMRDYIMAMPGVMDLYKEGELSGWEGEFSEWCTGVGEDNIYYRRQMHGLLQLEQQEDKNVARTTHFYDSVAGTGLSVRERYDLATTRTAVNHHLANSLFDFTNAEGELRTSAKEAEDKQNKGE